MKCAGGLRPALRMRRPARARKEDPWPRTARGQVVGEFETQPIDHFHAFRQFAHHRGIDEWAQKRNEAGKNTLVIQHRVRHHSAFHCVGTPLVHHRPHPKKDHGLAAYIGQTAMVPAFKVIYPRRAILVYQLHDALRSLPIAAPPPPRTALLGLIVCQIQPIDEGRRYRRPVKQVEIQGLSHRGFQRPNSAGTDVMIDDELKAATPVTGDLPRRETRFPTVHWPQSRTPPGAIGRNRSE